MRSFVFEAVNKMLSNKSSFTHSLPIVMLMQKQLMLSCWPWQSVIILLNVHSLVTSVLLFIYLFANYMPAIFHTIVVNHPEKYVLMFLTCIIWLMLFSIYPMVYSTNSLAFLRLYNLFKFIITLVTVVASPKFYTWQEDKSFQLWMVCCLRSQLR